MYNRWIYEFYSRYEIKFRKVLTSFKPLIWLYMLMVFSKHRWLKYQKMYEAKAKSSNQKQWTCHSHYTSIKNQTTTRKCIGNIYIWKFPIDTWGLDYNLYTISDFQKSKEKGKKERRGKEGKEWGRKETYIHTRHHLGCLFPREMLLLQSCTISSTN